MKAGEHFHKIGPRGLRLVIDTRDEATPCMVYDRAERYSATFECATCEGELLGSRDVYTLDAEQLAWLDKQSDLNDQAYELARG